MKKLSIIVSLLVAITCGSPAATIDSLLSSKIYRLAAEVQKEYAPDKRTERFLVVLEEGNNGPLRVETTNGDALKVFKQLLRRENIALDIDETVFPAKELGGRVFGVANLSVCNNRTLPDHAAEMATQTLLGTPVEILKRESGFYLVRTPDRYLSWIESLAVRQMDEEELRRWQSAAKLVFTGHYGHSYQAPSRKALPVSDLVAGNILVLLGKKGKFFKVGYPDGRIGYVARKDVTPYQKWLEMPNPKAEEIIKTAKTFIGVPYLWGGTSIKGVDCSGFTKMCFYLNGVSIPRDASQQALVGQDVDIFEGDTVNIEKCIISLQAGDLLFFAAGKNRRPDPRVTHTAIYIGGGQFIQSAGLVRINSMLKDAANYDDFQSRTLVGAKRFLPAIGSPDVMRIKNLPYYTLKAKSE